MWVVRDGIRPCRSGISSERFDRWSINSDKPFSIGFRCAIDTFMSSESIFNIFVYFDSGVACEYGIREHRIAGSESDKRAFLVTNVLHDHQIARRFRFSRTFSPDEWRAALRYGTSLKYFEEGFDALHAPDAVYFCVTPVIDGAPFFHQRIGAEPFRGKAVTANDGDGEVPDYLIHYMTKEDQLQFSKLIYDDYFEAIWTLYNSGLYVSCLKLLMSCIDTLSFVEYGDTAGNFKKWLDVFVDLKVHGISSEELWEFRNSVLHMTNLQSRKVLAGHVSQISFYISEQGTIRAASQNDHRLVNLYELFATIGDGINRWGATYNSNKDKFLNFIERYDTTISDARTGWSPYPQNA